MKHLEKLYRDTTACLESMDIPKELDGYWNLLDTIMILATDERPEELNITKVYNRLKEYDGIGNDTRNWTCQHAIQTGYLCGNKESWRCAGFGEKPSVRMFCISIADKFRPLRQEA